MRAASWRGLKGPSAGCPGQRWGRDPGWRPGPPRRRRKAIRRRHTHPTLAGEARHSAEHPECDHGTLLKPPNPPVMVAPKPKSQRLPRARFGLSRGVPDPPKVNPKCWLISPWKSLALLEELAQLLEGDAVVYHGLREQR